MQRLPALLALAFAVAGCGAQPYLLGTTGTHLLTTRDVVATPGERVRLVARLQGGDFLQDRPGHVILFAADGQPVRAAQTGEDGRAVCSFTPAASGDYLFAVRAAPAGFPDRPPEPQELRVTCRAPDAPMAVVDLDRTLVAGGFQAVLVGDPEPLAGSAAVMERLAQGHTILYLTHRPDFFSVKSKAWLRAHGYAPGPVLLSTTSGFLEGSRAYKTEALAALRERFREIRVGIGDKPSDALAYHVSGLKSILILHPPVTDEPADFTELAETLRGLPEDVHVVADWQEVGQALFGGGAFPPGRIADRLARRAEQLKARAATRPAEGETP